MSFQDAVARFQRGDLAGAETQLQALLARDPKHADALHLSAAVRHARGDLAGAADLFEAAFRVAPGDAAVAFNRAAVLAALKRHRACADAAADVLRLRPGDQEALLLRGTALSNLDEHEAALDVLARVHLERAPAYAFRAASLYALGVYEEALKQAGRALSLAPEDADALHFYIASLIALERGAEALSELNRVIALAPGNAEARSARAGVLTELSRHDEALADIETALAASPERAEFHAMHGVVLTALNRDAEAAAVYERSLALKDDGETRLALADALLAQGDFERGLPAYEARWLSRTVKPVPETGAPVWKGEALQGKTLLLQEEQGFGDLFQFCRFAPLLAARGARVTLQARQPTLNLLKSLAGVERLVSSSDPPPLTNYRLPLLSAMHALNMRMETIPADIPYLHAEPERVECWRTRLAPAAQRIGIAWSGVQRHPRQRWRSLGQSDLAQLISADEAFVSLQMEREPALDGRGVPQFGADVKDFAELAALIENVDLVISIDTGVAHLAGALGKPVWVMLPYRADWRWLRHREDTPWYSNMRLFRQTRPGEWGDVIERVHAALQE